jgi:hypothetical protein|tara:strand:+ start:165 stop:350 length:186 start_codon:yes stop_codon:yes gene_type:complete
MIRQLTILGVVGLTVMASNAMALAGSAGAGYKFGRKYGTMICQYSDDIVDSVYTKLGQKEN